jgi:hypothetical protein
LEIIPCLDCEGVGLSEKDETSLIPSPFVAKHHKHEGKLSPVISFSDFDKES